MTIRENNKVIDDERLMRSCATGDESALEILYLRYSQIILNYLYKMIPERTAAEDLTGETFFRVWRKAALFDANKGSFKTWLFRMASRLALNRMKKESRREKLAAQVPLGDRDVADCSQSPVDAARCSENFVRVHKALDCLNEKDRAVLVLRHFQGLGEQEVAQVLRIPRGTVKSRTYYAVRRLKVALETA